MIKAYILILGLLSGSNSYAWDKDHKGACEFKGADIVCSQRSKIHLGSEKAEVLANLGTPLAVIDESDGKKAYQFQGEVCAYKNFSCFVTFDNKGRMISTSDVSPSYLQLE